MYTKDYIHSENPPRVAQAVRNAVLLAMRPYGLLESSPKFCIFSP